MSVGFPKICNVGSGRLSHRHDYIRDIWLQYEKHRPVILGGATMKRYFPTFRKANQKPWLFLEEYILILPS
jgi:hypothetical protein